MIGAVSARSAAAAAGSQPFAGSENRQWIEWRFQKRRHGYSAWIIPA
jgi:hypothetical protein